MTSIEPEVLPEVLVERHGAAGVLTLNRPKALNALTLGMVRAMDRALNDWAADPSITRIIVRAAGGRAFSAGGDIRHLHDLVKAGAMDEALSFWREEYHLNVLIHRYPKPYISLIDGIVMGGGAGVSINGSHRIAGDRFTFAMPEVGIGFFPDVGATYFLPRLPGELGAWCALTGNRIGADDAVIGGLATHRVASDRLEALFEALVAGTPVEAAIAAVAQPASDGPLGVSRSTIARLFTGSTVEAVLAALDAEAAGTGADTAFSRDTAALIRTKSPTSLRIALAQVRRGGAWSFEDCMRAEFRIVSRLVQGHDFVEGVRAAIIDKDNAPVWLPATLADCPEAVVDHHFAPLGVSDLVFQ